MSDISKKTADQLGVHLKDAYQDTVEDGVPEAFQMLIDENLKKGVEETLQEGIPDRFRDLLSRLSDATDARGQR